MRMDITNDLGQIKLGNTLLPGVYDSCEIQGGVKLDEIDVPGQSGQSTQPQGFEDATITLRLRLINDNTSSPYDKAQTIIKLFRSMDSLAKPYVYNIVNPMTRLWGIREVIFTDLRISDSNRTDIIEAEIVLREYKPAMIKKESSVPAPAKQTTSETETVDTSQKSGFAQVDLSSVLPTVTALKKTAATPAKDDDAIA